MAEVLVPKNAKRRDSPVYLFTKRLLDILISSLALILLAPLMLLIALLIKLESPGPALIIQQRVGKGGKTFPFLKFRTMINGAELMQDQLAHLNEMNGPVFKIRNDPRVTRLGRFLRKYSLDELPQFINVLKGEMTLVGPRPPLLCEVQKYQPHHFRRLEVTGGITCLWQINGRNEIDFEEWVKLDVAYIENRSLWLDLWILLKTIPAVLSGRGAY